MSFVTHRCSNSIPNSISCGHDMSTYHGNIDFEAFWWCKWEMCPWGFDTVGDSAGDIVSKGLGGRALLEEVHF